jgi:hypothetical protein
MSNIGLTIKSIVSLAVYDKALQKPDYPSGKKKEK